MPLEYYFMLAGLVLLLIEFVVPGFGIFGVSGMVCDSRRLLRFGRQCLGGVGAVGSVSVFGAGNYAAVRVSAQGKQV